MTDGGKTLRRSVLYAGTVQGVGFRYTADRVARRFSVSGFVRNLPDGRVEVVAEGAGGEVARFLAALEEALSEYVRDRQVAESPGTGEFVGFTIRF